MAGSGRPATGSRRREPTCGTNLRKVSVDPGGFLIAPAAGCHVPGLTRARIVVRQELGSGAFPHPWCRWWLHHKHAAAMFSLISAPWSCRASRRLLDPKQTSAAYHAEVGSPESLFPRRVPAARPLGAPDSKRPESPRGVTIPAGRGLAVSDQRLDRCRRRRYRRARAGRRGRKAGPT